jgi:hypothetical protein
MATVLNVRNEETELDLLRSACVIDAPRGFYADPLLPELKQLIDPVTAPTLIDSIINHANGLTEQQTVRSHMETRGLPMAYNAFKIINRPGKQYFPIMRLCGYFAVWEYMDADEQAMLYLRILQHTITHGEMIY